MYVPKWSRPHTPYSHILDNPDDIIWNQGGRSKKVTIGNPAKVIKERK